MGSLIIQNILFLEHKMSHYLFKVYYEDNLDYYNNKIEFLYAGF